MESQLLKAAPVGLIQKKIVDKNGHLVTRYVSPHTGEHVAAKPLVIHTGSGWEHYNEAAHGSLDEHHVIEDWQHAAAAKKLNATAGSKPPAEQSSAIHRLAEAAKIDFAEHKIGDDNSNAKSHNARIDKLEALAKAHDIEGILAMSFGTNTYGKKQAALANKILAVLGSDKAVAPGHKGDTPKVAAAAEKPVTAAAEPTKDTESAVAEHAAQQPVVEHGKVYAVNGHNNMRAEIAPHYKGGFSVALLDKDSGKYAPLAQSFKTLEEAKKHAHKLVGVPYPETAESPKAEQPAGPAPLAIKQFSHTKTGSTLHAVQLPFKVSSDTFEALMAAAKPGGGHWSSFAKDGAIPGFLFKDAAKAHEFAQKAAEMVAPEAPKPALRVKSARAVSAKEQSEQAHKDKFHATLDAALSGGDFETADKLHAVVLAHNKVFPDQALPEADTKAIADKIAAAKSNAAPKEGDTKSVDGVTYILQNGRWHKQGVDAPLAAKGGAEDDPAPADDWKKLEGQKGTNPGGLYEDEHGQKWYIKTPQSADHARNERLAAELYGIAGLAAQSTKLVTLGGKVSIASRWENLKKVGAGIKGVKGATEGFAMDAWLANWDVVGLEFDNLLVHEKGGAFRVDAGGSLLYRAQGAPKGDAFGTSVTELQTLRDPKKAPQAAAVFGGMTDAEVKQSAKLVQAMSPQLITDTCVAFGPGSKAERLALAQKLIARRDYILGYVGLDADATKPQPAFEAKAAAAAPAVGAHDFEQHKLPEANTNAKSHNGKVEQIKKLYEAGDAAGLQALKFGTNTYGKKQAKLAAALVSQLGAAPASTPEPTEAPKFETPVPAKPAQPLTEKQAMEMGAAAFAAGKPSSPAQDPVYMQAFAAGNYEVGAGSGFHHAWSEGWHKANLAAPVPESAEAAASPASFKGLQAQAAAVFADSAAKNGNPDGIQDMMSIVQKNPKAYGAEKEAVLDYLAKKQEVAKSAQQPAAGPKEGDTKQENGHTYVLKNGHWERADKDMSAKLNPTANVGESQLEYKNGAWHIEGVSHPLSAVDSAAVTASIIAGIPVDSSIIAGKSDAMKKIMLEWAVGGGADPEQAKSILFGSHEPGPDASSAAPEKPARSAVMSVALPDFSASGPKIEQKYSAWAKKVQQIVEQQGPGIWKGSKKTMKATGKVIYNLGGMKAQGVPGKLPAMDALFDFIEKLKAASIAAPKVVSAKQSAAPSAAAPPPAAPEVPAPKKPKVKLDPTALPVKPDSIPAPHDFLNWGGAGKGLSSKAHVNEQNLKDEKALYEFALKGNLIALQDYHYDAVDKESGAAQGKKPIAQHPSNHVKTYWSDLVSSLNYIANPPEELARLAQAVGGTIKEMAASLKAYAYGKTVNNAPANQRLAYWMALGNIPQPEQFAMPGTSTAFELKPKGTHQLTPAERESAKAKFAALPTTSLVRRFITGIQASGSYNDNFRDGKMVTSDGKDARQMVVDAYAYATEKPPNFEVYKWISLSPQMLKQLTGAPSGTTFQNPGSMCCSYDPTATAGFGQHRMRIRFAPGAKAVDTFGSGGYASEKEITTLPGAKYVIVSAKEVQCPIKGKRLELDVMMLPPDESYLSEIKASMGG